MEKDNITFSFGKNWFNHIQTIDENDLAKARLDINEWLGDGVVKGKKVIDIGCGSGIHSLGYHSLGAKNLLSFDYDEFSVKATREIWKKTGEADNWKIKQGSILDDALVDSLGKFEIVYSWGVLHHTGDMWKAIENAMKLVDNNGLFWISIYQGVDTYEKDLAIKKEYNNSTDEGKKKIEKKWIRKVMLKRLLRFKNPYAWNTKKERGMSVYTDIVDWLGGLPYEVASLEQIKDFCSSKGGLKLLKTDDSEACLNYLFQKT